MLYGMVYSWHVYWNFMALLFKTKEETPPEKPEMLVKNAPVSAWQQNMASKSYN